MQRVEELFKIHPSMPEWQELLSPAPTCNDFEPRFLKVLHLKDLREDGSFYTPSGLLVARFFTVKLLG